MTSLLRGFFKHPPTPGLKTRRHPKMEPTSDSNTLIFHNFSKIMHQNLAFVQFPLQFSTVKLNSYPEKANIRRCLISV